jgi:hypothetical protein
MPDIIRVEGLVKKFGEFTAVAGIDFTVQAGKSSDSWDPMAPENPRPSRFSPHF